MDSDEVAGSGKIWQSVPKLAAAGLIRGRRVLEQKDTLLSFETLGRLALQDPEPLCACWRSRSWGV